jgi:hypothetical protein
VRRLTPSLDIDDCSRQQSIAIDCGRIFTKRQAVGYPLKYDREKYAAFAEGGTGGFSEVAILVASVIGKRPA